MKIKKCDCFDSKPVDDKCLKRRQLYKSTLIRMYTYMSGYACNCSRGACTRNLQLFFVLLRLCVYVYDSVALEFPEIWRVKYIL